MKRCAPSNEGAQVFFQEIKISFFLQSFFCEFYHVISENCAIQKIVDYQVILYGASYLFVYVQICQIYKK